MLICDLRVGESIRIGEAVIRLDDKSGQRIRCLIEAPGNMPVRKVVVDGRVKSPSIAVERR